MESMNKQLIVIYEMQDVKNVLEITYQPQMNGLKKQNKFIVINMIIQKLSILIVIQK